MAKRFKVGIFCTGYSYRVIVLNPTNSKIEVLYKKEFPEGEEENLAKECREFLETSRVTASLPPQNIFFKTLSIPLRDVKKIIKVLPFEMESFLPMKSEEMVVSCLKVKEKVVGVAVEKEFLKKFVEKIDGKGFFVDSLKDCLLPLRIYLEGRGEKCALLYMGKNFSELLASTENGFYPRIMRWGTETINEDLDFLITEILRTLRHLYGEKMTEVKLFLAVEGEIKNKLIDSLRGYIGDVDVVKSSESKISWPFSEEEYILYFPSIYLCLDEENIPNFRTGEFSPPFKKGIFSINWKVPLTLSLFFFLIPCIISYYKGKAYSARLEIIKARELNLFVESFPEIKKVVNPYLQMKEIVKKSGEEKIEKRVKFIQTLYEISKAVEGSNVKLKELNYFEGVVDIDGEAPQVELIDVFQNRLSEKKIFGEVNLILSRKEKEGGFSFRIRCLTK